MNERVSIKIVRNVKLVDVILTHLIKQGYRVYDLNSNPLPTEIFQRAQSYVADSYEYFVFTLNDAGDWISGNFGSKGRLLSLDEVFELGPVKPAFVPVKVVLDDSTTAEIQEDGSVKVGCRTFRFSTVFNLLSQMQKVVDNQ